MKRYFVYFLASYKNGTIYIGVTGDLSRRVSIHQSDVVEGFTKKYSVHDLVYFEEYDSSILAIQREKQLKKWNRSWKIELIEKSNPDWNDLSEELMIIVV
jgi:putative endonuclease